MDDWTQSWNEEQERLALEEAEATMGYDPGPVPEEDEEPVETTLQGARRIQGDIAVSAPDDVGQATWGLRRLSEVVVDLAREVERQAGVIKRLERENEAQASMMLRHDDALADVKDLPRRVESVAMAIGAHTRSHRERGLG